jgi:hypothetical protein
MNRGSEELQKTVTVHGSKIVLARRVKIQPYQLSHILKGARKPNFEQRAWFEDNLGIGWRLWDVEIVVPKTARARKKKLTARATKPIRGHAVPSRKLRGAA